MGGLAVRTVAAPVLHPHRTHEDLLRLRGVYGNPHRWLPGSRAIPCPGIGAYQNPDVPCIRCWQVEGVLIGSFGLRVVYSGLMRPPVSISSVQGFRGISPPL